jgi:hypothetical protein
MSEPEQAGNGAGGVPGMTVVNGGEKVAVTMIDGSRHEVFVRIVPISRIPEYFAKYEDMAALISLATGEKIEALDGLSEDSFYGLNRRTRALNDPRFGRWLRERKATVMEGGTTLLKEALASG